jgi:hypothetical protein
VTQNGFVTEPDGPDAAPETQQQRAMRAIAAIFSGGDLAAETLQLSNEFTDRQVARLKAAVRRTGTS